jgi:DNA-binding transcriptional ArsR family regulator
MSTCMQHRTSLARLAAVAKAMANEHRLKLLVQLACGVDTAEALAERSELSISKTWQHLGHLKRAGLITMERHDHRVTYGLADSRALTILDLAYKTVDRDFEETEHLLLSYLRRRKCQPTPREARTGP